MQEMIEVIIGYRHTVVPKSNEPMIRQVLAGSPDEKKLIIVPYPPKLISKEKELEIIKKLEPVAPVINTASVVPEPKAPEPVKKKPGRPKKQT